MAGDPDILVPLTSARTEFEGQTIAAALEADGIPAKVFATSANMLQWDGAPAGPGAGGRVGQADAPGVGGYRLVRGERRGGRGRRLPDLPGVRRGPDGAGGDSAVRGVRVQGGDGAAAVEAQSLAEVH